MKRLLGGLGAVLLVTVACTTAPGSSPGQTAGTGGSPTAGLPGGQGTDLANTAQAQLCDTTSPTGLTMLATELDNVSTADTTQLSSSLNTALTNLQDVDPDAATEPARAAAESAVMALIQALNDPNTRDAAATTAAQALREVDSALCM